MLSVIRDIGRERERENKRLFLSLNYANPGHLTVANDDVAGREVGGGYGTSKCAMYLDSTYIHACVCVCACTDSCCRCAMFVEREIYLKANE